MKGRESPKRLSLLLFTGMGMRQNLSPSLPLSPSLSLSLSHTHTKRCRAREQQRHGCGPQMPPLEAPKAFSCPGLCCSPGPTGGGEDLGTYPPCSQYEWTHSRLVLSHSLTVLSSLADTMSRPSGENLKRGDRGHNTNQQTPQVPHTALQALFLGCPAQECTGATHPARNLSDPGQALFSLQDGPEGCPPSGEQVRRRPKG